VLAVDSLNFGDQVIWMHLRMQVIFKKRYHFEATILKGL